MSRADIQVFDPQTGAQNHVGRETDWRRELARQAVIIISASLFVALCARVSVPLPFTPVPLTLQNFGVLAVGLVLGSRRGFAALALYLIEGACGLPVFSPAMLGSGITHLLGPTGGFLMAYPLVAFVAGWLFEHGPKSLGRFAWAAFSAAAGELILFAGGLGWLAALTHSFSLALKFGFYGFIFAEIVKVMMAAGVADQWQKRISPRL